MISQHRDGDIAVIEIDRHERRNALDAAHCDGLRAAVREQAAAGARALVITGAGSSFCSGADLGGFGDGVYDDTFRDALYAMLAAITGTAVPVIAAVNGPAIGAGAQVALACDLRVAAPAAAFAVPTARLGLAVDPWTIRRLTALAGGATAQTVLIGCDTLDAAAALRCGLASRLGDLAAALAWARELATLAPLTLAYSKQVLNSESEPASDPADSELLKAYEACWTSEDRAEGQRARADKRTPQFRGQ
jgi:enoyl-CoA hydratase